MNYENKKVAIIGNGIEGQDAKKFLESKGAMVTVLDQKDGDTYLDNLDRFDVIIRSPGVYPDKIKTTKRITTPTHIFFDQFDGTIIGVTGTKGKGTTSTLIYEILKSANFDAHLAGNIGKPALELLPLISSKSYVVLEMSSFQLIDLSVSPHVAVILNITSDHMDWHKDQNEYVNAKKNIVRFQNSYDWAVINSEYKVPESFAKITKANIIFFNRNKLENIYKKDLILRGEHNLENIAAAVDVAKILKVDEEIILKTIKNFKGLDHRLEFVREINGIKFYNDSFATGPQPTIAAIKSFSEDETLILGGSDKGLDYKELGKRIEETKNVKNIILIGDTSLKIENSLKNANCKLKIIKLDKPNMSEIVKTAFKITQKGGVVILSPASASFDMFLNYKDRGNQFKQEVLKL